MSSFAKLAAVYEIVRPLMPAPISSSFWPDSVSPFARQDLKSPAKVEPRFSKVDMRIMPRLGCYTKEHDTGHHQVPVVFAVLRSTPLSCKATLACSVLARTR